MKSIEGLTDEEERAATVFRALGNPARIRIVTELARRNACVAGDFVDVLPLAQSTVSQHLKVLKEAGIISGSIDGDQCYCLNPETVRWLAAFCTEVCCPTSDALPDSRRDAFANACCDGDAHTEPVCGSGRTPQDPPLQRRLGD